MTKDDSSLAHTPPRPGVAVVLVHYGDPGVTRRCLESLARLEPHPHWVVVVDHGPGPGLDAALEGAHPAVEVLRAWHNPGFGAGCNLGADRALSQGAEALWFLNNDATLSRPILGDLLRDAQAFPEVGLWGTHQVEGSLLLGADRQPAWFGRGLTPPAPSLPSGYRNLTARETLSGASLLLTRGAWQAIGPWPEWCFLYWEDAAWCRQAVEAGQALALSEASVDHLRGTTTGRHSARTLYYGARNALLLHRQIHPRATLERLLLGFDFLQKRFFRGQWSYLPPIWKGIRDALRTIPRTGRRDLP